MEKGPGVMDTAAGGSEDRGKMAIGLIQVLVDYKQVDFRGFIFVLHENYGLMMLRCTRKKDKGPHWQVPGGHIDETEFLDAAKKADNREGQLQLAGKAGAARELFEETGIDVRSQLDRISPANLRIKAKFDKDGTSVLANEYKYRLFYFLTVTDDDFAKDGVGAMGTDKADCRYKHIKVNVSVEHSGFTFQQNPDMAYEMLLLHSGGKVAEALKMAMQVDSTQLGNSMMKTEITVNNSQGQGGDDEAVGPTFSPSKRRSKRHKDTNLRDFALPPLPEKKNIFCCFGG